MRRPVGFEADYEHVLSSTMFRNFCRSIEGFLGHTQNRLCPFNSLDLKQVAASVEDAPVYPWIHLSTVVPEHLSSLTDTGFSVKGVPPS